MNNNLEKNVLHEVGTTMHWVKTGDVFNNVDDEKLDIKDFNKAVNNLVNAGLLMKRAYGLRLTDAGASAMKVNP